MDDRIKELIAIGASITANCQPCLEYDNMGQVIIRKRRSNIP